MQRIAPGGRRDLAGGARQLGPAHREFGGPRPARQPAQHRPDRRVGRPPPLTDRRPVPLQHLPCLLGRPVEHGDHVRQRQTRRA